ncbi:MAG: WYL domain-containing protein, partial [Acidaminococcaceae bacterium]|nr:WYL domain-containing protein [Acidaminococcaceae bacterium]
MSEPRIAKDRLLRMCARLTEGHTLYKKEEAERYCCSLRSIQRDIDDLRAFFADRNEETGTNQQLIYDREENG